MKLSIASVAADVLSTARGRLVLAALMTALGVASMSAVASAQEYPLHTGALESSSDGTIAGGESVTVSGTGFTPGAKVVVTIESDPVVLGAVFADAAGAVNGSFTVPKDMPAGTHTLKATGEAATGGVLVLAQTVQVPAAGESGDVTEGGVSQITNTSDRRQLASTGLPGIPALAVASALLLVGGTGAVVIARRRA